MSEILFWFLAAIFFAGGWGWGAWFARRGDRNNRSVTLAEAADDLVSTLEGLGESTWAVTLTSGDTVIHLESQLTPIDDDQPNKDVINDLVGEAGRVKRKDRGQ